MGLRTSRAARVISTALAVGVLAATVITIGAGAADDPSGGAIFAKWVSLGDASGLLGKPTGGVNRTPTKPGAFQTFEGGSIYWSSATGAKYVRGAIRDRWGKLGWENGYLGFPTSDENRTPNKPGAFQTFQGGSIYRSSASGTHSVRGLIRDRWGALGWENGFLGFPTSDELDTARKDGKFNSFQGGAVYWKKGATQAYSVWGHMLAKWSATGYEAGLGYPVMEAFGATRGGAGQWFESGSIYWSPTSNGPHIIKGLIRDKWGALGSEKGLLGFPTSDELATPDGVGRFNTFEGDASIYWTPITGAHPVSGAIRRKWASMNWEQGAAGYPTSDPRLVAGGIQQQFQGGTMLDLGAAGVIFTADRTKMDQLAADRLTTLYGLLKSKIQGVLKAGNTVGYCAGASAMTSIAVSTSGCGFMKIDAGALSSDIHFHLVGQGTAGVGFGVSAFAGGGQIMMNGKDPDKLTGDTLCLAMGAGEIAGGQVSICAGVAAGTDARLDELFGTSWLSVSKAAKDPLIAWKAAWKNLSDSDVAGKLVQLFSLVTDAVNGELFTGTYSVTVLSGLSAGVVPASASLEWGYTGVKKIDTTLWGPGTGAAVQLAWDLIKMSAPLGAVGAAWNAAK